MTDPQFTELTTKYIDTVYRLALTRMKNVNLDSFSLNAVTDGEDAIGEAVVKIDYNGELYTGTGISTDVIEASIRAYVNGINKIKAEQKG